VLMLYHSVYKASPHSTSLLDLSLGLLMLACLVCTHAREMYHLRARAHVI